MKFIKGTEFFKARKNGDRVQFGLFECVCGKRVGLVMYRGYAQKSCGCERWHKGKENNLFKHGLYHHPLYLVWRNMKLRCFDPKSVSFERYGAKGISVCAKWMEFQPFYDWATSNGWQKGLVLDRKDSRGNYEPSNCRFITAKESARNRPTFVKLSAEKAQAIRQAVKAGESHRDIAKRFGTSADMVSKIKRGKNWI